MGTILIVDDDAPLRQSFRRLLHDEGYDVLCAFDGEQAVEIFHEKRPDVVIMDVRMPGMGGLAALAAMRETDARVPVLVMTAFSTTETAIEAIKLGAYDYVIKPFDIPSLLSLISRALDAGRRMRERVVMSTEEGECPEEGKEALIGVSKAMHEVYKAIGRVAPTDALVLIRGESGTGKELTARAIYQHSSRARLPLVIINCVAIPDGLLESELFGHERGAFTGATDRRVGKIEQANGGTVFLDEIGDMPLPVQAKLLRLLQERQIERLGGQGVIAVNVRMLAATNADLEKAVAEGRFREDLYYRLKVLSLELPPLRDRREDIPLLTKHFLCRFARESGLPAFPAGPSALKALSAYDWPGNVRELANTLREALIFNQGVPLSAADIQRALGERRNPTNAPQPAPPANPAPERPFAPLNREEIEKHLLPHIRMRLADGGPNALDELTDWMGRMALSEALRANRENRTRAARMLGITRPTLLTRMEKYGLRGKKE
jgi:two-component system NtrC family response regulator/two-component system nitrogen regulation response regulator GlnG